MSIPKPSQPITVKVTTVEQVDQIIKKYGRVAIIQFYADWCEACQRIEKIIKKIKIPVNLIKVDIDKEEDLASRPKIKDNEKIATQTKFNINQAEKFSSQEITLIKFNIDQAEEFASRLRVKDIPAFFLVVDSIKDLKGVKEMMVGANAPIQELFKKGLVIKKKSGKNNNESIKISETMQLK